MYVCSKKKNIPKLPITIDKAIQTLKKFPIPFKEEEFFYFSVHNIIVLFMHPDNLNALIMHMYLEKVCFHCA